jgi:hypothetical protein
MAVNNHLSRHAGTSCSISVNMLVAHAVTVGGKIRCLLFCRGDPVGRPFPGFEPEARSGTMTEEKMAPIHPGEVLYEDFMKPLSLSQNHLGRMIRAL